jgi:capsid protein
VGTGIVPQSRTGDAAMDKQANELWEAWGAHADAGRRHDIYGLQALASRTRAEAGEALILLRPLSAVEARRRGTPVPLALHVLEPDHLDANPFEALSVRQAVPGLIQGVELDEMGGATAYRFWPTHPGDQLAPASSVTIPARYLLHLYRQTRPGQVRGVPDLAPVMTRLRLLDEYEDAVFMQQLYKPSWRRSSQVRRMPARDRWKRRPLATRLASSRCRRAWWSGCCRARVSSF